MIYTLLGLIHSQVFQGIKECIRIHSGCGEYNGNRFLVVGDKGTGKTTLMTRLLFEGFHIDGDELVMVQNEKVTPLFGISEKTPRPASWMGIPFL